MRPVIFGIENPVVFSHPKIYHAHLKRIGDLPTSWYMLLKLATQIHGESSGYDKTLTYV